MKLAGKCGGLLILSLIGGCSVSLEDKRPLTILGCEMFQPICVNKADIPQMSRDTKEQIATHNKFWAKTCGKGTPPCEGQ